MILFSHAMTSEIVVPARVAQQIERMSEVLQMQAEELERLACENQRLRDENSALVQLATERAPAEIGKVAIELSEALKEKQRLEHELRLLKERYAKSEEKCADFARILELTRPATPTRPETPKYELLARSRAKAKKYGQLCQDSPVKADVKAEPLTPKIDPGYLDLLEKEKNFSRSTLLDLEKSRQLVLEKDCRINDLQQQIDKANMKILTLEESLAAVQADLVLEQEQKQQIVATMNQMDVHIQKYEQECLSLRATNENLKLQMRHANIANISLAAKLDAQGKDLIRTKQALQASTNQSSEH